MTDLRDWPALEGWTDVQEVSLEYRRGIWGKVHGQSSDYRWIARSPGFAEGSPDFAGALRLGAEDKQTKAPLWRRLPDRWLAVSAYPSRAQDSAGRLTVVEKQVFEWRTPKDIPAVLGALALLPEVARRDDSDWWERQTSGAWDRPECALPLEPPPPISVHPDGLRRQIELGLDELFEASPDEWLVRFYSQLLSGRFPAALRGGALSPTALAVLLLPLPRRWAEGLSFAGGMAAQRVSALDLRRNWDGVVHERPIDPEPTAVEPEIALLAKAAVAGLRGTGLGALRRALAERRLTHPDSKPPPEPIPPESPSGAYGTSPSPLGRPEAAPGAPTAFELSPQGAPSPLEARPRLARLSPPPPDSPPALERLFRLALEVDERRIDLEALRNALDQGWGLVDQEGVPDHPLLAWPEQVARQRPHWVDPRDWRIKRDQLKAAAALLIPDPERACRPGLPRSTDLPGLLPMLLSNPRSGGERLARLGESACLTLISRALKCPDPLLRRTLVQWLKVWRTSPSAPAWRRSIDSLLHMQGRRQTARAGSGPLSEQKSADVPKPPPQP